MAEHTPLPWFQDGRYVTDRGDEVIGKSIADCAKSPRLSVSEQLANAAYIVKACNAFPEAVTLLNALLGLERGSGEAAAAFVERHADLVGNFAPVKGAPDHG